MTDDDLLTDVDAWFVSDPVTKEVRPTNQRSIRSMWDRLPNPTCNTATDEGDRR